MLFRIYCFMFFWTNTFFFCSEKNYWLVRKLFIVLFTAQFVKDDHIFLHDCTYSSTVYFKKVRKLFDGLYVLLIHKMILIVKLIGFLFDWLYVFSFRKMILNCYTDSSSFWLTMFMIQKMIINCDNGKLNIELDKLFIRRRII